MSTDTDEEYATEVRAGTEPAIRTADPSTAVNDVSSTSLLLITANVGSVFEDAESLSPKWRHEVIKSIAEQNPQFVAIHFQEVSVICCSFCLICKSRIQDQYLRHS